MGPVREKGDLENQLETKKKLQVHDQLGEPPSSVTLLLSLPRIPLELLREGWMRLISSLRSMQCLPESLHSDTLGVEGLQPRTFHYTICNFARQSGQKSDLKKTVRAERAMGCSHGVCKGVTLQSKHRFHAGNT